LTNNTPKETSPFKKNLSPQERKAKSKRDYNAYVLSLELSDKKFPINQDGMPNYTAVAEACGFGRPVLYGTLAEDFEADILRIGTELSKGTSNESRVSKKSDENKKKANKLQKLLDAKEQEVIGFRKDILKLEKKVDDLEANISESTEVFKDMLDSGRCFKL
jgi:hypothetical protein